MWMNSNKIYMDILMYNIVNQVDLFPDRVVVDWINRLSVNVPQSPVAAAQLISPWTGGSSAGSWARVGPWAMSGRMSEAKKDHARLFAVVYTPITPPMPGASRPWRRPLVRAPSTGVSAMLHELEYVQASFCR